VRSPFGHEEALQMFSRLRSTVLIAVLVLSLAIPAVAFAGGDQVQYGQPVGDMPYGGEGDRTDGDWGNPDNNG